MLDGLMKCIVSVTYRRRRRSTTTVSIVQYLFPLTFISATTNDNVDRFQYPRSARRQVETQGPLTVGLHLLAQTQKSRKTTINTDLFWAIVEYGVIRTLVDGVLFARRPFESLHVIFIVVAGLLDWYGVSSLVAVGLAFEKEKKRNLH